MPSPAPTIIDCDPGVDDVLALLLALTCSDLRVIAYVPQFGNCELQDSYSNILKLYGVLQKHFEVFPEDLDRFPGYKAHAEHRPLIVKGAKGPISGDVHTAKYFHGQDGLGGITENYPDISLPSEEALAPVLNIAHDEPGYKAILRLLQDQPDNSVIYIALGPLTNLALALQADTELFRRKVKFVSIMGGALDVPGNTSPVAEFNVYADSLAANAVFAQSSSIPIYLSPLDITCRHILPWTQYTSAVDPSFASSTPSNENSPLIRFTSGFLRHTADMMARYGKHGMELHDPLAVYFAMKHAHAPPDQSGFGVRIDPAWKITERDFVVEYQGKYTTGMCVVDRRHSSQTNNREKGRSKAELQEELDKKASGEEDDDPADVQVDEPGQSRWKDESGIRVITGTPGSQALVKDMLEGIWGANIQQAS